MPIYEYQCEKCSHEFEREQRITEDPVKTCPKCRGRKVKKLISRTSFVLKGGGWYSDLYSSSKKDSGSGSESSADGSDSSSDKKGSSESDGSTTKSGEKSEKSDKSGKKDDKSGKKDKKKKAGKKNAA